MSAFVCILDRSGADLDSLQARRLAAPLAPYGDCLSLFCRGPVAIAVRHGEDARGTHRWGPLVDPESGVVAAVAGQFVPIRRDRGETASSAPLKAPECAAMALAAHRRDEPGFLTRIVGSFTAILADPARRRVSLARDHLGDLKVYYYLDARWLIAASEPAAILRHGAVATELDEHSAVRFLAFRFSHGERSFFQRIRELPPAHRLRVTSAGDSVERYWRFRVDRGHRPSGENVQVAFRALVRKSLANRMAGIEPHRVALSLSGGLDSTSLAALAPAAVRAYSWRFGQAADDGERRNITAVANYLGKTVRCVDGDGLHPLCDGYIDRFVHPSSPHLNAFAALKHALYRVARADGCQLVLVGDGGDALYSAREYWLRDTLSDRRPGAVASLAGTVRRAWRGDTFARVTLRRLLPFAGVRAAILPAVPPWLTREAHSLLTRKRRSPILPEARRTRRYELAVGAKHTELESEERRLFAQCGVERGNPFWSWPLLEMVIGLPAYWYHDAGRSKVLTREAMKGRLPAAVLESGTVGLLGDVFLRGIESHRREIRDSVFEHPRSDWRRWVKRSWVEPYLDATGSVELGHTILWRVISYELWQRRLIAGG